MFPDAPPRGSAPLVAGLTLLLLGAIAFAIPRARLVPEVTGVERGLLTTHSRFSDQLAAQLNVDGYNFLAIDLTGAPSGEDAHWLREFDAVARIFEVWGFLDARGGVARIHGLSVPLKGLFLYAPTAAQVEEVRRAHPGLRVLPVVRDGAWTGGGEHAVALAPEAFAERAKDVAFPVLLADRLDMAQLRALRARAAGSYLVSTLPIPD